MSEKRTLSGRIIHRCTVCGNESPWTDKWSWFGSYRDIEECNPIDKFCSEACKDGHAQMSVEGRAIGNRRA